jgi:hypothetical protein
MFTRRPATVRTEDEDGEEDPPLIPVPTRLPLQNENGENITDENGEPIWI